MFMKMSRKLRNKTEKIPAVKKFHKSYMVHNKVWQITLKTDDFGVDLHFILSSGLGLFCVWKDIVYGSVRNGC